MGDGNVNYALAEPYSSKSSSYFGMNNQFDLFGKTVNLKGSTYRSFPMISDEPVKVKPKPKVTKKSLWAKIAVGMAVVGCVALVAAYGASLVFTGGASAVAAPYIVGTVAAIGGALFVNNKANEDIENQTESGWLSYMWAGAKGAYTGAEIGFAAVTIGQLAYGFLSALGAGGGGGSLALAGAGGGTMSFALETEGAIVAGRAIEVVIGGAIGLEIVSALEAAATGGGKNHESKTYEVNGKTITEKEFKNLRRNAVKQAWKQEAELVNKTGKGSRDWTESEKAELLTTGKVKGYEGQHMKSAEAYPNYAGNSKNIQFLKGRTMNVNEHLDAHKGNYQNPTNWRYDPKTKKFIDIDEIKLLD